MENFKLATLYLLAYSASRMSFLPLKSHVIAVSRSYYSGSKNCPNVCSLLRDQYGMKC